ncbi:histidine kinase/DNA gyrase B/HSP90-like ATPase [Microvirga subterranea]|uniref:histidine kinase n=2 Tax=Microvirga subterranea TaxID=186651 RepID=A0A370HLB9_9HYPH|nr:histidine kinase/DNA gyrase B/HSP90-like ATPase [Microvirga subterranea]
MTSDDVQDRSEKIWRASLRLQELIETILSYTRINAGALAVSLSVFNLDILVRQTCQEYQRQEPSRSFLIDLKDLPDVFVGDPVLIEQALAIVLSNAVKYSPAGAPITIRNLRHKDQVVIEVADQGLGVPETDLPYLTQPFFRARNVKHVPGTGLGLSLVSHILKLHGGSVQIKSREGHGTTLRLILPDEAPPGAGAKS